MSVAPEVETWLAERDLCTSLTIDNLRQSDVGKILDALREAGFSVEINVSRD